MYGYCFSISNKMKISVMIKKNKIAIFIKNQMLSSKPLYIANIIKLYYFFHHFDITQCSKRTYALAIYIQNIHSHILLRRRKKKSLLNQTFTYIIHIQYTHRNVHTFLYSNQHFLKPKTKQKSK